MRILSFTRRRRKKLSSKPISRRTDLRVGLRSLSGRASGGWALKTDTEVGSPSRLFAPSSLTNQQGLFTNQQGLFTNQQGWIVALLMAALFLSGCQTTGNFAAAGGDLPTGGPVITMPPVENVNPAQPNPTLVNHNVNPRTSPPAVTAKAAIVVDARTGTIIYAKNIDQRLPVASTQKLLLGLMMVEGGNLQKTITIQKSDTWAEPTIMGIKPGEKYTKSHLLKTVLVRSSNDISRALARDQYGSVQAFAAAANQRAKQLGMRNSFFTNASGLPNPPGQFSTARDLSILAAAAMQKSVIRDAVRTPVMTFRRANGKTQTVYNTNKVLRTFPYCTGAKTGYTNAAGRCLISTAEHGRKSVIVVILGSKTPNVWTESQALLSWGLGM